MLSARTPFFEASRLQSNDTLLTLRHMNLPDDAYGRSHEEGWESFLSRLSDGFSARV
jgi:hypothetical protein